MSATSASDKAVGNETEPGTFAARARLCRRLSGACAALLMLLSAVVLAGWQWDLMVLRSGVPSWNSMQPLTAVAFAFLGLALATDRLGWPRLARLVVLAAAAIAVCAVWQHLTSRDLGIDAWLFPDKVPLQALKYPGRMAEISTVEFLLFAAALWLSGPERPVWAFWLPATIGLVLACIGVTGYVFGAQRLTSFGSYAAMAVHSAIGFMVAFLGLLLSRPRRSWVRLLISTRLGGTVVRRLIPVVIGLPLAVGCVVQLAFGRLQAGFQLALALVVVMAGLSVVIGWLARQLDRVDAERASTALRMLVSEAAFRAAQEAALFGVALLDAVRGGRGKVVAFRERYVNPAALRLLGAQDGNAVQALLTDGMFETCAGVAETGRPFDGEVCREVAGSPHWLRVQAVKVEDGIAISLFDITDRRQAERGMARAEARYRSVVDTAVDAMVVIDEHGTIAAFNRSAERTFGYTVEEAMGRNVRMLMPEPDRSSHDDYLANYKRTGEARIIGIGREVTGRRKDGSTFPVELAIAEWRDGPARFFTGIMRDITARKAAEDSLKRSEASYRTVFDQAAVGIVRVSLDDGRILEANRKFCSIVGYTMAEVAGLKMQDIVAPGFFAAEQRLLVSLARRDRDSFIIEKQYIRKDGSAVWVRVTTSVPRGESSLRISVVEDISEQMRILTELQEAEERARRAQEAAEAANRAKSAFLAAASHDLRQPVQAMVLMNGALSDRLQGHPAATIVRHLSASIGAMQRLLEGLLDVSRLDAGVVTAAATEVALGPILERLGEEYAAQAAERGLTLRHVRCSAWCRTDPMLFERILRNLIENALRYNVPGGRVLIGCRRTGDRLKVIVRDTGIGIPADMQALVFQEFFQVGNPERDREKGLGLGLSIVRRLAGLLGHRLDLVSRPGWGSCFTIETPAVPPPATLPGAEVPPQEPAVACEAGRILVIDDERMVRDALSMLLVQWGCEVLAAADCDEAVALSRRGPPPDVILADFRLREGRNGVQAAKAVEAACGRPIPTIVLTGDTDPDRLHEIQRGGYPVAHKPVVPERLRAMVVATRGRPG
ncbi:PAS domain S-box protein [Magnetospirillum sp. UT-4]|uniref:hybrid sensor histidine kinase/response regulator n=1 Tax=Magnetospirillum sp. UT-4 TaxID=2681467 RepID=UPI001571A6F4|nr:PAS domain S-box protein [Magnetospirillum sp. UT-4]